MNNSTDNPPLRCPTCGAPEVAAKVDALADEYALTGSPYLIQRDVIVADLRAILRG